MSMLLYAHFLNKLGGGGAGPYTCILSSQIYLCYECKLPWTYIFVNLLQMKINEIPVEGKYGEKKTPNAIFNYIGKPKMLYRTELQIAYISCW